MDAFSLDVNQVFAQGEDAVCVLPQNQTFGVQQNLNQQILEANRKLESQSVKAWITPCCKSIKLGIKPPDTRDKKTGKPIHHYIVKKFDIQFDPYSTGSRGEKDPVSWNFGYTDSRYYRWMREGLADIGVRHKISEPIPYQIPIPEPQEKITDYYLGRLREELQYLGLPAENLDRVLTLAGTGSQSLAFWYHDPMPSDRELEAMYPQVDHLLKSRSQQTPVQARRNAWASANAKTVIKLRTYQNWKEDPQDTARQTKRDLILGEIFEDLASRFKFVPSGKEDGPGESLIQVLKYYSTRDELMRGVSRQDPAVGESVYYIAGRVRRAMQGDKNEERYLIDELKFSSLEDAKQKINILENFYRSVHNELYNFQVTNDLIGPAAYTHSGRVVSIGFDYNLGRNVVWNSKLRKFIVFDY